MHSKWIFCAAVHSFYKQNLQQQHLFFIVRRYMCTIHSVQTFQLIGAVILIKSYISLCSSKYDINFEGVFFIRIVSIKVIDFMFLKKKTKRKIYYPQKLRKAHLADFKLPQLFWSAVNLMNNDKSLVLAIKCKTVEQRN